MGLHLDIIGFVGGSLSSQHCIVASHLYGNTRGGSHSGVAKWDLRTQGGQVSRVLITGLNADTASSSRQGGRNRFALASVHPPPQSVPLDQTVSGRGAPGPGSPRSRWEPSAGPSSHAHGPRPLDHAGSSRGAPGPGPPRSCWTPSAGPSSHTYGLWPAYGPWPSAWPPSTLRGVAVVPGDSPPREAGRDGRGG